MMSDYPEHDKLAAVVAETQAAGEFIEWLGTQRIFLARYECDHNFPREVPTSLTTLLAEWQGIDQRKLEAEKRQMLASLRTASEPR
jgi:hypothetical protein